jgi:predicted aldo/keto reductase-like oxidoreductase
MVLSGMSDEAQMHDNVATFEERTPLSEDEKKVLAQIAEGMMDAVPCTGCRYCCDGCPMGLDIPGFLHTYNELRTAPSMNAGMRIFIQNRSIILNSSRCEPGHILLSQGRLII